ncbi:MAG: 2-amino-4-hydroxy-6-hydroxymethyldihydropteridine diphosphokinase [Rubricoccaceae bacterium]
MKDTLVADTLVADTFVADTFVADAFVGLGSNAGDRAAHLRAAVRALARLPGTRLVAVSPVYETEAHVLPGQPPQPDHLNAAAQLATTLAPEALLAHLHAIEAARGRRRNTDVWQPRPLDLDLLLYADLLLRAGHAPGAPGGLVVPHPRLAARRFVLAPLADLAPGRRVPGLGRTVRDLLRSTSDRARVAPFRLDLSSALR